MFKLDYLLFQTVTNERNHQGWSSVGKTTTNFCYLKKSESAKKKTKYFSDTITNEYECVPKNNIFKIMDCKTSTIDTQLHRIIAGYDLF